jgi:hypothetical protein
MAMKRFTWTKGLFSGFYKIYSNGNFVGKVEESITKNSTGWFNGKDYIFRTHGFFNQNVEIIDCESNSVVGNIVYNNWMTKAALIIDGKSFNWKYDDFWNTRWSISASDGINTTFNGSATKGSIVTDQDDGLLILTGLFITNYYWQMTLFVILMALFTIVIVL